MNDAIEQVKKLPPLVHICEADTLGNYFRQNVEKIPTSFDFPERTLFLEAIKQEVAVLYGASVAHQVCVQLAVAPIVDTGTHAGFMKDFDNPNKGRARSDLNQNVLVSGAMMHFMGYPFYVGLYSSANPLAQAMSGGYFQIGQDVFPVASKSVVKDGDLYDSPAMDETYFNPMVCQIAKFRLTVGVIDQMNQDTTGCRWNAFFEKQHIPDGPERQKRRDIIAKGYALMRQVLSRTPAEQNNCKEAEKQYTQFNAKSKQHISETIQMCTGAMRERYHMTPDDIDAQYQMMADVMAQKDLSLSQQALKVQTQQINRLFEGTGMTHIGVDFVKVASCFLEKALQDKTTIWYQIFSDEKKFQEFHRTFLGIRSTWGEGESPFAMVQKKRGMTKIIKLPLVAMSHTPTELTQLLKTNQIVPTTALMIAVMQSAGFLGHGGYFQATFAEEIREKFAPFVARIGHRDQAAKMAQIPADMMLLSLVVAADTEGRAVPFSALAADRPDEKKGRVQTIPFMSSCRVIQQTLGTLAAYLGDKTEYWDYVNKLNKPALPCAVANQPCLYQIEKINKKSA